jgi:hypothetical protein
LLKIGADLRSRVNGLINAIFNQVEVPLNGATINPKSKTALERLRNEISALKTPLTNIVKNLNTLNFNIDINAANRTLEGYQDKIDALEEKVRAFLTTNDDFNNTDTKIKQEEAAKREAVGKDAEFLKDNIPVYIVKDNMYKVNSLSFRLAFDKPAILKPSLKSIANINGENAEFVGYANTNGAIDNAELVLYIDNTRKVITKTIKKDTSEQIELTGADNIPYIATITYSLDNNANVIEAISENILPGALPKRAYVISLLSVVEDTQKIEAARKAAEEAKAAEEKRIREAAEAEAAKAAELAQNRADLRSRVNEFINTIYTQLEAPLNNANINSKSKTALERLRNDISALKGPLIDIVKNLNILDFNVDFKAANQTLKGYQDKINALETRIQTFFVTNDNFNAADNKLKAEETAKKDIVEKDAEFLKDNIPVYIIKDNMYKVNSLTFRLAFDKSIAPKSSLKSIANINGENAEFVGYATTNGTIDNAELVLYIDNTRKVITKTIKKDTSEQIELTGADNIPYIATITYSLDNNANVIEAISENILPGILLKRAYVISLLSVVEDTQSIEAARKAAEEAKAAEEKRLKEEEAANRTSLRDSVNTLLNSIATKLEDPIKNRAPINEKLENEFKRIEGEIKKLKDPLADILKDLNKFDANEIDNAKKMISGYDQKINKLETEINALIARNDDLNELDRKAKELEQRIKELKEQQDKLDREAKTKEAESKKAQLAELDFLKQYPPIYINLGSEGIAKLDFDNTETTKSILKRDIGGYQFGGYASTNGNLYKGSLLLRIKNQIPFVVISENSKLRPEISIQQGDTTYKAKINIELRDGVLLNNLPDTIKAYFISIVPGSIQVQEKPTPTPTPTPREKTRDELIREYYQRHH